MQALFFIIIIYETEGRMRKYAFIATGGILGAVLRYLLKGVHIYGYQGNIPWNTLFINITGSFILALILTVALEVWDFDADIRLGIATGFLGAYTTFSTLCREAAELMREGFCIQALAYAAGSVILGLAAVFLGIVLAREVIAKLLKKDSGEREQIANEESGRG